MPKRNAVMVTIVAALLVCAFGTRASGPLQASGVIQAEEVRLACELQGYAARIPVKTGDPVGAGEVLVVLASNSVQSSVRQAQAAVESAQADLELSRAAPRAEQLAGKRAQLAIAKARQDGAFAGWQAALETLRNPQDLQEQILVAEGQVALAAQAVQATEADCAQARAVADAATWNTPERHILELEADAAQAALEAARADENAVRLTLQHLRGMRDKPIALQAQAHAAESEYRLAVAAVNVTRAELEDRLAGPMPEEVAVAEAKLALAQAEVRLAQTQLERLTIRSPVSGTVVERMIHTGEVAMPGVTLLTVADLSVVTLVVYVPEDRLGDVHVGQPVDVSVDSFPQRRFEGQVVHIADQAQYTPRNVATKDERVNTVYAVKIRLPNSEGLLKPGMAADATFRQ